MMLVDPGQPLQLALEAFQTAPEAGRRRPRGCRQEERLRRRWTAPPAPAFEAFQRAWGTRPDPPAITVAGLARPVSLVEMDVAVVAE